MQKETYYLNIAGIICKLEIGEKKLAGFLQNEYSFIKPSAKPLIDLSVNRVMDTYRLQSECVNRSWIIPTKNITSQEDVDFIIRSLLVYICFPYDITFLHGAAFSKNNRSYAFIGPSGRGKTTIINGVAKNQRLSDDTVVIKKEGAQFYLYFSPFDKKCITFSRKKIVVDTIFLLQQSLQTRIINLTIHSKIANIFANDIYSEFCRVPQKIIGKRQLPRKIDYRQKAHYTLMLNLLKTVRFKKLFFTRELSFIDAL